MKQSGIRESGQGKTIPDFIAFHPGYACCDALSYNLICMGRVMLGGDMDYLFRGVVVLFLLCVLWVPTAIAQLRMKHLDKSARTKQIAILFPLELGIAVVFILIADRIGLLNPAGYILAITFFVGGAGAVAALFWSRATNHPRDSKCSPDGIQ